MPGAVVTGVVKDSIAHALGIEPGYCVLALNDQPLQDILDYRFFSAEEELKIHLTDAAGNESLFLVEKHPDEPLGMEFDSVIFDEIAECSNHCSFCFIDSLPRGMRPSLYLKDDDYRLSFLHGNFVTLTNLSREDWKRIAQMRLSPLYVSVHTTDHALRQRMLGCSSEETITEQLEHLGELGIQVHAQIVVIPGVNDGPVLEKTLEELVVLHPTVQSVGVVPVGTTRHRRRPLPQVDRTGAKELLEQLTRWQEQTKQDLGEAWVYPGDEWYPLAGRPYPPAASYGDFPQLENGVGMAALFLEELNGCLQEQRPKTQGNWVIVTGTLAAPLLEQAARSLTTPTGRVRVLPVSNQFFGPEVTAAGLLCGNDVLSALKECSDDEVAIIPEVMLRGNLFLDDLTLEQLRAQSPVPVEIIPARAKALAQLLGAGRR